MVHEKELNGTETLQLGNNGNPAAVVQNKPQLKVRAQMDCKSYASALKQMENQVNISLGRQLKLTICGNYIILTYFQ